MKEFISILISFLFMSLADSIDSAFNNSINMDAIVVCGSVLFLKFIIRSIGELGIYTYRVVRKNEASYLYISGFISLIVGIFLFLLSDVIVDMFDLTIVQKELLSDLLKVYIFYFPLSILHCGLLEIVRLKGKLKLYRKGLFLHYFFLILLDLLVFIFTKNLILLFVATAVADLICFIYLTSKTKIKFNKVSKEEINNIKKYGIGMSAERLISRLFIFLYGVLASYLGTDDYAIHSICYGVCLNLEIITNAYSAALMIKIPEVNTKNKQKEILKYYMKKCFILIIVLNFLFAFIYLLISHGKLPLYKCFPYIIFYSFAVFGLYKYESYKALCVVQGKPKILLVGSTIGVIIRVLVCLLFLKTPFALYIFGLSNMIDFYSRSIIYRIGLSKTSKKIELNKMCKA